MSTRVATVILWTLALAACSDNAVVRRDFAEADAICATHGGTKSVELDDSFPRHRKLDVACVDGAWGVWRYVTKESP